MKHGFRSVSLVAFLVAFCHAGISEVNARLGKGVNLAVWLEAPNRDWGVSIDSADIARIAAKGFSTIRVPTRWETRTAEAPPYTIDPTFFRLVDSLLGWASANHLNVVLNMHNHDSLMANPTGQKARFLAMWSQIASYYQGRSDSLVFEILNEPNGNMTADLWNEFLADALDTIRATNPTRPVIIGAPDWSAISAVDQLILPNDSNLILTVHYYEPYSFTHQGATWLSPVPPSGVSWDGSYLERLKIKTDMDRLKRWAVAHNIPVWIGEFGSWSAGDMASRSRWTNACARFFEQAGFSWSYWEYESGFGAYDPDAGAWRDSIADPLFNTDTSVTVFASGDTAAGEDLLINGDFEQGLDPWVFSAYSGVATGDVVNGAFQVVSTDPGTVTWSIIVRQLLPVLLAGHKYAIALDAWADSSRTLDVNVQNQVDWTVFGSGILNLSTVPDTYVVPFYMDVDDSASALVISFGKYAPNAYIDNVRLVDLSTALPPAALRAPVHRGAYPRQLFWSGNRVVVVSNQDETLMICFRNLQGQVLERRRMHVLAGTNVLIPPRYSGITLATIAGYGSLLIPEW